MKIMFDVKHPGHVHFFRNAIARLREAGHEILVTSRQKEMTMYLLERYGIPSVQISSHGKTKWHLLKELPTRNIRFLRLAKKFRPDAIVELMGVTGAPVGKLLGVPSLVFQGAENTAFATFVSKLCSTKHITPHSFKFSLGKRHAKYHGNQELAYLHPKYFQPDPHVLDLLGLKANEPFTLMRFISWGSSHDVGHTGLSLENKIRAVGSFSRFGKVFISSEKPLPHELQSYELKVPHEYIHSLMSYSTLLYGESATMASESAALGTYSIYVDDVGRGYTDELEKNHGLVFNFKESPEDQQLSIEKGVEILRNPNSKVDARKKRDGMIASSDDVTQYIIDNILQFSK